jgi:ABC-type antimicrobial peptide transport system permease subunit
VNFSVFELDQVIKENLDFLSSAWTIVMFLPSFTSASAALCLISYTMLAVEDQRREFAILRALGAKPKTVVTIIAVQSLIDLLSSFAVGLSLKVIITLMILIPHPVITSFTIFEIALWLFTVSIGIFSLGLLPAVRFAKKPILKIML